MKRKNEDLANRASLVLLNGTLVLIWVLIIISLCYRYYNLHVYAAVLCVVACRYIIGFLTTCLVIFVNVYPHRFFFTCSFSVKINSVIPKEEEDKKEDSLVFSTNSMLNDLYRFSVLVSLDRSIRLLRLSGSRLRLLLRVLFLVGLLDATRESTQLHALLLVDLRQNVLVENVLRHEVLVAIQTVELSSTRRSHQIRKDTPAGLRRRESLSFPDPVSAHPSKSTATTTKHLNLVKVLHAILDSAQTLPLSLARMGLALALGFASTTHVNRVLMTSGFLSPTGV